MQRSLVVCYTQYWTLYIVQYIIVVSIRFTIDDINVVMASLLIMKSVSFVLFDTSFKCHSNGATDFQNSFWEALPKDAAGGISKDAFVEMVIVLQVRTHTRTHTGTLKFKSKSEPNLKSKSQI